MRMVRTQHRRLPQRFAVTSVCVAMVWLCGVSEASAQGRPYRSLFGGAANSPYGKQELSTQLLLTEGYDTNVLATTPQASQRGPQIGGTFTSVGGDVQYGRRVSRVEFAANGSTEFRYFPSLHEVAAIRHAMGAGVSAPITRKTIASVNGAISYTPSYLYGLFAKTVTPPLGAPIPPASNYGVGDRRSYAWSSVARIDRPVGRRNTLDFIGDYRQTTFTSQASSAGDLETYSVGSHFGYRVSRDAVLRLGYDYRRATYASGIRSVHHDIGSGIDYDRPLSRSRRTRLGFNFGSTVINAPPPGHLNDAPVNQWNATGNVLLTHEMGRTWSTRAAYRRGAQYRRSLGARFADSVTLTADGFLNRRTDVQGVVAYTTGSVIGRTQSDLRRARRTCVFVTGLRRRSPRPLSYLLLLRFPTRRGIGPGLPKRSTGMECGSD